METGTASAPAARRLTGCVELRTERGTWLSDTRVRLLEAIERHGSIVQAARQVPVSYKTAWDAVDDMNRAATSPVVVRSKGGRAGGGTRLTEHGRRAIAIFRTLEAECQGLVDRMAGDLDQPGGA